MSYNIANSPLFFIKSSLTTESYSLIKPSSLIKSISPLTIIRPLLSSSIKYIPLSPPK